VLEGLRARRRAIPARWLYDEAGSGLFDEITALPEYYPTRTEIALLEASAPDVARLTGPGRALVELGSGSSAKTPLVIRAISPSAYVPIDISGEALRQATDMIRGLFPDLAVLPEEGDFMEALRLPAGLDGVSRLGFFPGSTIGNLAPAAAVDLLRRLTAMLGPGSLLLIGMDRIKPVDVLLPAYDDSQGVTARFNLNLLHRINRDLDGDIPVDAFVHRAVWNAQEARVEMHLEAIRDGTFSVSGEDFSISAGETIHTENSHKYCPRSAHLLLAAGGWRQLDCWTDANDRFLLILAEARPPETAP